MKPLILALDVENQKEALAWVKLLSPYVDVFKVGYSLFWRYGPPLLKKISSQRKKIFLDLKLHDIPHTVELAVKAASELGVYALTIHTLGGEAMLKKAALVPRCPKLWGVTVLTSMDQAALRTVGINNSPAQEVLQLAGLAQNCGLNGVIASVEEVKKIKLIIGKGFTVVTPGIRLNLVTDKADQKRVATPEEAIGSGSDFIIVGRPILAADNPLEAVKGIYRRMRVAKK
ncbi:MAG: orotidine-5'-phosphate decarboxylase [Elusimicrobiota bacterium]